MEKHGEVLISHSLKSARLNLVRGSCFNARTDRENVPLQAENDNAMVNDEI